MLKNLIILVKEHSGDVIIKNPAIPDQHNDSAIETVAKSIFGTIKSHFNSGGIDKIKNFLGASDHANHEITQEATAEASKSLMDKFKLPLDKAKEIAEKLVPNVMASFAKKTNDPNDASFDINGIAKTLGANTGGFFGRLKKLF